MHPLITPLYRAARALFARRSSLTTGSHSGGGLGGGYTLAGVNVTAENALTVSAVYASVNRIATDLAALAYHLHRRRPDKGADLASEDPRYQFAALEWNEEQGAFPARQTMVAHALLAGDGYASIERDPFDGSAVRLWLMDPRRTRPDRTRPTKTNPRGQLFYFEEGNPRAFFASDIIHIHPLGWDGLTGKSPIALHREGIGLARAAQGAAGAFFANGSKPGGVLKYPGELSDTAKASLRASWERIHGGAENAGAVAILEEGMAYESITLSPEDAQYIETRKFEAAEIARIFAVPPHKIGLEPIGDPEAGNLEYLSAVVLPWAEQIEQEWTRKLVFKDERATLYFEHSLTSYLRGNSAARSAFYRTLFDLGVMSPNQIAAAENLEPIGPAGDRRYLPVNNYAPIDALPPTTPVAAPPPPPTAAASPAEDPLAPEPSP
jgi:HK97 family phage portal protein